MNKIGGRPAVRVIRLLEPDGAGRAGGRLPADALTDSAVSSMDDTGSTTGSLTPWPEPVGSLTDSAAGDLDTQPCAPEWPRPPTAALRRAEVTEWPVTCRADPADYARLWRQQAVWCLLTLGLYLPWARRQWRHFFLQHTFVAGRRFDHEQPLITEVVWHGLVASLALSLTAAAQGAALAGAVAVSLVLLVWPLWLGVGYAQTVGALRWGRRPLSFRAPWWRVYRRMLPWVAAGLVCNWLAWWALSRPTETLVSHLVLGVAVAGVLLMAPGALWAWWTCRQWHLGIGPLALSWRGTWKGVYGLAARVALWGLVMGVVVAAVYGAVLGLWLAVAGRVWPPAHVGLLAAAVLIWAALVWPYAQAHAQNLVWQDTGCRYLRFRSRLSVMAYVRLRARHLLWLVGTLGLAWPWVAVQARRMRLEAVTVVSRVDPADLRAAWREPVLPRRGD